MFRYVPKVPVPFYFTLVRMCPRRMRTIGEFAFDVSREGYLSAPLKTDFVGGLWLPEACIGQVRDGTHLGDSATITA